MSLLDNLISYWKFDESSGNASDSVGGNNLVNNNGVVYNAGLINNGADMSGGNTRYMSIADASQAGLEPSSGSFSFQVWWKINSNPGADQGQSYLHKFGGGGNRSYSLNHDTYNYSGRTNHLTFSVYDVTGAFTTIEAGFTPTNGAWHHFVCVADSVNDLLLVYLNGSLYMSVAWTGSGTFNSSAPFQVSDSTNQGWVDGQIDEAGFWDRALTSAEVTELYNSGAGLAYPFTPPVTYAISGVVSLSSVGVEGATVRCIRQSDNVALTEQTTDSTGAYEFSDLDVEELYHLCVEYASGETKYYTYSYWDITPVEVE